MMKTHEATGNAFIQYKAHRNGRITDDQGGQSWHLWGRSNNMFERKGRDQVVCMPSEFLHMTRFASTKSQGHKLLPTSTMAPPPRLPRCRAPPPPSQPTLQAPTRHQTCKLSISTAPAARWRMMRNPERAGIGGKDGRTNGVLVR